MLGVKTYKQTYIDKCRSRVDADLLAYKGLVSAAKGDGTAAAHAAIEGFEARFFNEMVVLLDALFVHRLRNIEGKDGNPLNEVRVLSDSMLNHNNVMTADKSIKLSPEKSVLKYKPGDEIKLTEADFVLLSKAFLSEIESKYTSL